MTKWIKKRDGKVVEFDNKKITHAVVEAMKAAGNIDYEYAISIGNNIEKKADSYTKEIIGVEDVQDMVENELMKKYPDTARRYIKYRAERTRERNMKSDLMNHIKEKVMCTNIVNSNANIDERSFGGKKNEAAGELIKDIAYNEMLDPEVKDAVSQNYLYIHDFTEYAIGTHNCLNINMAPLLKNGFMTRNGGVRGARSISTACQLVAVIFQANSQCHFGGCATAHLDRDLAPFVRISFLKHFADGLEFTQRNSQKSYEKFKETYKDDINTASIDAKYNIFDKWSKPAYKYARAMLEKEGLQSLQGFIHNMNTLESRPGSQLPFTSVNTGLDTSFEGRCVTRWLFEATLDGIGKFHLTPIFPISIFTYKKDINDRPGTPNYDLFKLAIKCLTKRIYPNICNSDWTSNEPMKHPTHIIESPDMSGNTSVYVLQNKKIVRMTIKDLYESKDKVDIGVQDENIYHDYRFCKKPLYIVDSESKYNNNCVYSLDDHFVKVNYIIANQEHTSFAITTETFRFDYSVGKSKIVKSHKTKHFGYAYDYDTEMATMGCRTLIGRDRFGLGSKKSGRGNVCPATINLPKLGIEYGICLGEREKPDLEGFWKKLNWLLRIQERSLIDRFNYICSQSVKSAYFMYTNHTMYRDTDEDCIYDSMKHNTLAIGFIGISNMLYALFGKYHDQDKDVLEFGLKVIRRMSDFVKEASERNNLNFSLYATPAEGSCYTICKALQKEYGKIKGVTDREYLNNSFHVPVYEKVSIKDKIDIESKFTGYCTGGTITYVELDTSINHNLSAVEDIIRYAMKKDIPYFALNHDIDNCLDCGYSGEISNNCPECGSDNIQYLRRVTGYLTADYKTRFNNGKKAEVEDRVKHSKYTNMSDLR